MILQVACKESKAKLHNTVVRESTKRASLRSHLYLTGQDDKSIKIWSTASGQEVATWQSNPAQGQGHLHPPACIAWAPRRLLVASACYMLNLWIPAVADLKQMGLVN